jgi:hypothetical protein
MPPVPPTIPILMDSFTSDLDINVASIWARPA